MFENFPFLPPADWHDFPQGSNEDNALVAQWNANLAGFTSQGIIGNPWTADGVFPATPNYFNPATNNPEGQPDAIAPVQWDVFPGRILAYNPDMPANEALQLADTGSYNGGTFPVINSNPCDPKNTETEAYGPYGPRGWQDEYCEWSVQYDPGTTNIRRVDFTCENPEYWNTLWMTDPGMVLQRYQETLDNNSITMADLTLMYAATPGATPTAVIDPSTGRPAYNPLNKWNCGPQSTFNSQGQITSGGAMHLTSTPNTIQTEIGLGSSATVQRKSGNANINNLICCGKFGQIYRNSDPNIGAAVNRTVNKENNGSIPNTDYQITLTNPPGLYIQMPNLALYSMNGAPDFDFSTCFTVKRGYASTSPNLPAPLQAINTITGTANDFILHLTFEVPEGYTAADITIDNTNSSQNLGKGPLQWGGQIAATFNNQILATAYAIDSLPAPIGCVGDAGQASTQAVQLFHADIFAAMYNTLIPNPVTSAQPLLSNSTMIAPLAQQGNTYSMVLVTAVADTPTSLTFYNNGTADSSITATINNSFDISYSVPGNTYPSSYTALAITVTVGSSAATGLRGIAVNSDPVMPALLNIIAPSN